MTITDYIETKTIEALLDNKQRKLEGLLRAGQLAIACFCPEGHGEDEISLNNDGDAYCAACDEYYSPVAAAVDVLHDLGYYDVYAE